MQLDMAKFRDTFFAEAADHLAAIEAILLRLEGSSSDLEAFDEIFRSVHSVKGAADMFGLAELGRFAHALESLLDRLRRGEVEFVADPPARTAPASDRPPVRDLVRAAKAGAEGPLPIDAMLERTRTVAVRRRSAVEPRRWANPASARTSGRLPDPVRSIAERLRGRHRSDPSAARRHECRRDSGLHGRRRRVAGPERSRSRRMPTRLVADAAHRTIRRSDPQRLCRPRRRQRRVDRAGPGDRPGLGNRIRTPRRPAAEPQPTPRRPNRSCSAATWSISVWSRFRRSWTLPRSPAPASQPRFGQICLREGKLTVEKLFEILNSSKLNDMRIGATAVALRHLSGKDVQAVLALQRAQRKPLGEILVELGTITASQLQDALVGYKSLGGPSRPSTSASKPCGPDDAPDIAAASGNDERLLVAAVRRSASENKRTHRRVRHRGRRASRIGRATSPGRWSGRRTIGAALDALYARFHTVKGTSSFFNLRDITKLAHAAEDLLNAARDGTRELTGASFDLAFASVDGLKRQLERLKAAIARGDARFSRDPQVEQLVARFASLTGTTASSFKTHPADVITPKLVAVTETETPAPLPARPEGERLDKEIVRVDRDRLDKLINIIGELVIGESMVRQEFAELPIGAVRESRAFAATAHDRSRPPGAEPVLADDADRRHVPADGPHHPRPGQAPRQADPLFVAGRRDGARQDGRRSDRRSAHAHGPQCRRSRHRDAGRPHRRGKAGARHHHAPRAFHQSGNIYIEIEDDGKVGLDRDAILQKAIASRVAWSATGSRFRTRRSISPSSPALASRRRRKSRWTSPDAASAWTWCKPQRRGLLQGSISLRSTIVLLGWRH